MVSCSEATEREEGERKRGGVSELRVKLNIVNGAHVSVRCYGYLKYSEKSL
jgi:hypothetical protein